VQGASAKFTLPGWTLPDRLRLPPSKEGLLESMSSAQSKETRVYTMVVGTLMVLLIAYGILELAGLIR
jgi:hypothetical protein